MAYHNPQEDALATLLNLRPKYPRYPIGEDPEYSMDVNAPAELAGLRHERELELQERAANDPSARNAQLLKFLQVEQAADPYTGVAEQKRIGDINTSLNEAATYARPEVAERRRGVEAFELEKAGEPARQAGRYGVARERVAQAGELEQQQLASQSQLGAAIARGGGGGGRGGAGGGYLPSGLAERVAGGQTALGILDKLEAGFRPEYVGPARGRANLLAQLVPGVPLTEGFAEFEADSTTLANATIKAITGAQMSEPEARRIMGQIPRSKDRVEIWHAKARSMRDNLASQIENIRGVNAPGYTPVTEDRLRVIAAELGLEL